MAVLKVSQGKSPEWQAGVSSEFSMNLKDEYNPHAMDWSKPIGGPEVTSVLNA